MSRCPECQDFVKGSKCNCGWEKPKSQSSKFDVDPHHGKCAWSFSHGGKCHKNGVICPSSSEPKDVVSGHGSKSKLYCAWHYECFTKHLSDDLGGKDYQQFCEQEARRDKLYEIPPQPSNWDANDMLQIKGLIFLGKDSMPWQKAPKIMQEAAQYIMRTGWKPKNNLNT